MKSNQNGFAPIIALIIILLVGGVGTAVYVSSTKDSTPQEQVTNDKESPTTEAKTEAKVDTEVQAEVPEAKTEQKTVNQEVIPKPPITQSPKIAISEIKNSDQALAYGKDLICRDTSDIYNEYWKLPPEKQTNRKWESYYYFSPKFPNTFLWTRKTDDGNGNINYSNDLRNKDASTIHGINIKGEHNPSLEKIRATIGYVSDYSKMPKDCPSNPLIHPAQMHVLVVCEEKSFDYSIMDSGTYAESPVTYFSTCAGYSSGGKGN